MARTKLSAVPSDSVSDLDDAVETEAVVETPLDHARASLNKLTAEMRAAFPERDDVIDTLATSLVAGEHVLLLGPPGCIAADSEVIVNRAGNSKRMSIAQLVRRFNGEAVSETDSRRWDPSIPTMIQTQAADGYGRLGTVQRAIASGVKHTSRIFTETGRSVQATHDHPIMTSDGWVKLEELTVGRRVVVLERPTAGTRQAKKHYASIEGLHAHPYAAQHRNHHGRVPTHRLALEAYASGLSLSSFVERIRAGKIEGLTFFDPAAFAVHHKDRDEKNNDPSNLAAMTHVDHHRLHAFDEVVSSRMLWRPAEEKIVRVVDCGETETFDLSIVEDQHNFTANGFVVHNTAKSELARTFARALRAPFFVALLTRYTTPDELFGPFSLKALEDDRLARKTTGRLPEAQIVFLDEVFKGSSAILNALLTAINEREMDDDGGRRRLPLRLVVAASNELPGDEDGLTAFDDRFLVRHAVRYVEDDAALSALLSGALPKVSAHVSLEEIDLLAEHARALPLSAEVTKALAGIRTALRNRGISVSDRKLVKAVALVRAHAALVGAQRVLSTHLEILTHALWSKPSDIPVVREIVQGHVARWLLDVRQAAATLDEQTQRLGDALRKGSPKATISLIGDIAARLKEIKSDVIDRLSREEPDASEEIGRLNGRVTELSSKMKAAMGQLGF